MAKKKSSKLITKKHGKFIAPQMLAKGRGSELKSFRNTKESDRDLPISQASAHVSQRPKISHAYSTRKKTSESPNSLDANQKAQCIMHHASSSCHVLVMHFREKEYIEKDFDADSSYLDFLRLCKRFFDIYSVRFKITDSNWKELNDDGDIFFMMKEHEGVPDIHVYIEEDETAPLLSFKLPEDNLSLASTISFSSKPKVTNVRIIGDVKLNEEVTVCGDVIGGTEQASSIQMFITISKNFNVENDLQSISLSQIEKVFLIPLEAVGCYLVAKFTPMDEDGKFGDSVYAISDEHVKNSTPQENKNFRGKNKNKKVASLKSGEKLDIEFYNNRAVGDNHRCWSRHLGKIVRDVNICPVQVQTWKDMNKEVKNHLWGKVKECFEHENMESYREETLEHMGYLWTAWRSDLYKKYVKPCKTKVEALKNCPLHMSVRDWTWLVKEKFFTEEFQRVSKQNIENRGKTVMHHRTGSKPHRAIMYDMGGKDGSPPDFPSLFFETRQEDGELQDQETANKYDEIVKTTRSHPSLSTIEAIDKCFGPQSHNRIFGYGGGIKRKQLAGSKSAKRKQLTGSKSTKRKQLTGPKSAHEKLQDQEMTNNFDEIVKIAQFYPSLSPIEVIDKRTGPQSHNKISGHGGGKKRKQLVGSKSAYEKELEAKIQEKEEENCILKRRLERIEKRLDLMENGSVQPS